MKRNHITKIFFAITLCIAMVALTNAQDKPMATPDRDALVERGKALAAQDLLAMEYARRLGPNADTARNGFYIGMAVAEGHTALGPGKTAKCASLPGGEIDTCNTGVLFSVERNRNKEKRDAGYATVQSDRTLAHARGVGRARGSAAEGLFFKLGFDIGVGVAGKQTAPGPGKDKYGQSLDLALRAGFAAGVTAALERNRRLEGNGASSEADSGPVDRAESGEADAGPVDRVVSREIRCRGYARTGGSEYVFFTINSRPSPTGETLVTYEIAFSPDTRAAGTRGENLRPGFCAFVDRPIAASGPYRIRFETVANAQLKQALHGSTVDRSSTAAESYPDVNTIPIYLKGENHYWSFGGITDSGRGYFVASGNSYWKPSVAIDNPPAGSPTAPARRHSFPTKP
jgi:hypothetical protein